MNENLARFQSDSFAIALGLEKSGVSLYSVRDKKNKRNILTHKGELFSLKARRLEDNSELTLSSLRGWTNIDVIHSNSENGVLSVGGNSELPGVSVVINITGGADEISFEITLINNNGEYSLIECDYPALRFDCNANTKFVVPYGSGEIIPTNRKGGWNSTQNYPSYGASFQFQAFYNSVTRRGIYYGVHDPVPAPKKFHASKPENEKTACLKAIMPLSDIKNGRNSQKLAGRLVWKIFDGDWYDAALEYRRFIETEAAFVPDTDDNGRVGLDDKYKKISHWFLGQIDGEKPFADEIIEQAKQLDVPCGVHLYYWHQIPFDNDYPHYFPEKPMIKSELDKLQKAGILVMPYINGRLWDIRDRGIEDWQFSSVAKPYATKDHNGDLFIEKYSSKESDGSSVELAVMCPSSYLWQDKMSEVVEKVKNFGFDAIYMDQIAAADAKPCSDSNHTHLPGGGYWWNQSYNTMLDRITSRTGRDFMITSECTADPTMKYVSGYLSWLWIKNDQVPVIPVVYSDRALIFGRNYNAIREMESNGMRFCYAQSFLFGEQMGWINADKMVNIPARDFYIKLVKYRDKFIRFFYAGLMLRPPVVESSLEDLKTESSGHAYGGIVVYPAVNSSVFQDKKTGEKIMFLVNASENSGKIRVRSGLADGTYQIEGDISEKLRVENGLFKTELPGLSLAYIKFK